MQSCYRLFATVAAGLLTFACTALIPTGGFATSTELDAHQAASNRISLSGRQSMLSQQIARNACFVMAGIDPERYVAKTDAVVRQFDNSLKGLKAGDPNLGLLPETDPQVEAQLAEVERLWQSYGPAARQIAAGDVHPVPMQQLIRLNLETLLAMDNVLREVRRVYADPDLPADLNATMHLADRQRALSQKASKEVCFLVLEISGAGASGEIGETIAQFDAAMDQLLEGAPEAGIISPPNRQVKKQLERTDKAWSRFKDLLLAFQENPDRPVGDRVQLANLSDQVLREMDLALVMYTQ